MSVQQRFDMDANGRTGLGLAIVRKVLELHGGRLAVRSTANVGEVVVFTLPCAQPRVPHTQPLAEVPPQLSVRASHTLPLATHR